MSHPLYWLSSLTGLHAQTPTGPAAASQTKLPDPTPYAVVANDANFRLWEQTTYELDPDGQPLARNIN